ncbi:MAG TPA: hypothetical protein VF587_17275 [Solirubrobacteraceae bacterium]|jgi:hypothetical protein
MPHRRLTPRRLAAAATRPIRHLPDRRAAVRAAAAVAAACPGEVRVCWDLDNTLVDSGRLLREGVPLDEAVRSADPVAGMLDFQRALAAALPGAGHFVLSVRARGMRDDTLAWIARHGLELAPDAVALVRSPADKPAVWRALARGGKLVVVDDLSHGHEGSAITPYGRLAEQARRIADAYVDLAAIGAIAEEPASAAAAAERVAAAVGGAASPSAS